MPKYFNYCHREWMLLNINHLIPILILTKQKYKNKSLAITKLPLFCISIQQTLQKFQYHFFNFTDDNKLKDWIFLLIKGPGLMFKHSDGSYQDTFIYSFNKYTLTTQYMSDSIKDSKHTMVKWKDIVPPSRSLYSLVGERLQSANPINKREIMNNGVIAYTDNQSQAAQNVVRSMGSRINWPGLKFHHRYFLAVYFQMTCSTVMFLCSLL